MNGSAKPCLVCGASSPVDICDPCAAVARLVPRINVPLFLIVDGSYNAKYSGAGLVLVADSLGGEFIAFCACHFQAKSSSHAEVEALKRGMLWAPGVQVWTDCRSAVQLANGKACWLPPECRDPNHGFAHRLSRQARLGARAEARRRELGVEALGLTELAARKGAGS